MRTQKALLIMITSDEIISNGFRQGSSWDRVAKKQAHHLNKGRTVNISIVQEPHDKYPFYKIEWSDSTTPPRPDDQQLDIFH